MKKKRPDLKNLENLITPNYAYCWKEIGIQLDIPTGILNSIEIGFPTNPFWCCNKMWMYWDEVDTMASWDRVLKAIASPAVSSKIRSFTIPFTSHSAVDDSEIPKAVSELSCRSKIISINGRYKVEDDNWPLISPKHFTSVALIHHKSRQTKREVLAVATLQKRGDFDLQKVHTDDVSTHVEYLKQSKYTTTLSDIFTKVDGTNKYPDIILIEGVPGIGKTVLSKEIVFQWSNGRLLPDITLLFLIYLRDTESHKITSLESFVNYVSYPQVANHIIKYVIDNKGKNIMVVFDGYDELLERFRKNSFLYKMMTRNVTEIPFCNVVITSRPNVSAHLHDKVDLRVEILGFTNEDRKAYIVDALNGDNNKIEKVMTYLNNNPAINAYCYIPLNMTILLSFFQNDDDAGVTELPNTQTGINEKFICTTISRYIRKLKGLELNFSKFSEVQSPCDDHEIGTPCVGHEKGVPYGRILKEISKLAFKELEQNKIVFTTVELQANCPCLESQSENWNGLGLLKAVQLFTLDNNLRNVSFNFLHFTLQEILAAYHITRMSKGNQLKCMKETFWDNRYYNTWIMYVGLTKNRLPITFKHFLSGKWFLLHTRFLNWWNNGTYCRIKRPVIDDKIKCLHLFQCFSEAENNDLCHYVGQLLQENEIDLSGQTLSAINILTISLFLTRSTTKHWKVLNLSECFIGDDGIKQLHNSFTSNNRSKVCVDTLNLSHNNLTRSSVEFIAGLILEWKVKDIILNNVNQRDLFEEIMYQVMQHPIEKNNKLFISKFNENMTLFAGFSESEYLILSFSSISKEVVDEIIPKLQASNDLTSDVIHTLQDYTTIIYFNLGANISQFEVVDLAKFIKNNNFIEYLYFTKMQCPVLNELRVFFDALKSYRSLKYVDMSLITIDSNLVRDVAAVMENNSNLKEMKISKLLLRYDDFQLLKNYIVNITGLKVFGITGIEDDADLVNAIIKNYEIQQLTLSNCSISIKDLLIILSNDNLNWVDLSSCQLESKEVRQIFRVLKRKKYLKHVDLSENIMTSDVVNEVVAMIENNKQIQSLSLPNCFLSQADLRIIIQAMQTVSSLRCVDFNINEVDNELASDITTLFANNSELAQLNFGRLTLKQGSFQNLKACLVKLKGLKHLSITDCTFYNQDSALLEACICSNYSIRELIISNCKIVDNEVTPTVRDHVGIFDQLEILNLNNTIPMNIFVFKLSVFLSCSYKLRRIILCNCQLQPNETKQILMALKLKHMRHLECVDLSGNAMTDDSVSDMEAMIINNKHLQKLCLPNCVLSQTSFFITIIQAMQNVSSLRYADFNNNEVNDELASDVAILFTKNNELKISQLTLNQNGFQHLNNYLVKIKGLTRVNIIGCSFIRQNAVKLLTAINNNPEIQELNLSNCLMPTDQWSMLSCITKLKYLNLSQCLLQPSEIKEIFGILKQMKCLQHVDLSGNIMESDAINDVAAMIKNNEHIQSLSLPNCIINKKDFKIVIQAIQTVSSLQYIDFSTNEIDNELASDISSLFASNSKLQELNFCRLILKQSGFQHLVMHFAKLKGIECLGISDCTFTIEDVVYLKNMIGNNHKIEKLMISNCKMIGHEVIMADNIGRYDQLETLELKNISAINPYIHNMLVFLSCSSKLKQMTLCNCQLRPDEIKQILMALKHMRHLECVDLSGNVMTDDSVSDMEAMIINNKELQKLFLPNCVLSQTSFITIIQAMQNVSSLRYADFSNNEVNDELASDVAILFTKNNKLKESKISRLTLNQSGFQHLNNYLVKIKGLTRVNIIGCSFIGQNAVKLVTVNPEIQELNLSNCLMPANQSWSMLSCITKLKYLNLSQCLLQPSEIKEIFGILQQIKCLQHVDLSGNIMKSDAINDVAAMIKNNEYIQLLSLPNCIINKQDFKIIIQAIQTVSSLQYIDFSINEIDNELASDISSLFVSDSKLQELSFYRLTLKQSGFQHLVMHFAKLKGIKCLGISDCTFTIEDVVYLKKMIGNNHKIEKLMISNCKMIGHEVIMADNIGRYDQLETLELKNISAINPYIHNMLVFLSCSSKLKQMTLCNCQLRPDVIKQILMALKHMRHLECVDLSGNAMTDDSVSDMEAMIINNKQLQKLCLPNCVLSQTSFITIIQAMQNVSSLRYADFNNNKVNDELASDVAILFTKNNKLKKFKISRLTLNQSGFQHLNNYLVKIKGLTRVNIIGCSFIGQNAVKLVTANPKIQELNLSNGLMPANQSWSMLSCITKLKHLNLSQCLLQPSKIKEIFGILQQMKCLQHVDLSGNFMESVAINDVAAMIKNNEHIQSLSLPNCIINKEDFKTIIQAMQNISSLRYADFNNNEVNDELASDVAILFTKNNKLKEFKISRLTLNQNGFQHLNKYLVKIKGLTRVNIIGCSFIRQNVVKLVIAINNNPEIQELNLSNCLMPTNKWSMLSYITKLKYLNLSRCLLLPHETKDIFGILKQMRCLQHVDLSGNIMESVAINDVAAMIKNNEHIQSLSLPNCIINKKDFKIIIQAIQTVTSLQCIDFSINEIDNELASDISSLFVSDGKLQELKFCRLTLKQSGFQHLVMHFAKLEGIKCLGISDCTFTIEDVVYLKNMIGNNHKIEKLMISNCKMIGHEVIMANNIGRYDQLETLELKNISAINPYIHNMLVFLSCSSELKQMTLCNCQLQPDEIKQILMALKYMRHLESVDLSGNAMTDDSVSDMEAMIVNNKQLQKLCLPSCILNQASLRIICQALQTVSSLQYVDFSTNKIDKELANNLKSRCVTIVQKFS